MFALDTQADGDRPGREAEICGQVAFASIMRRKAASSAGVQAGPLFCIGLALDLVEADLDIDPDLFGNG